MSKIKIESPYPRLLVKDWYPSHEVVQFSQEHVLWLLKHILDLKGDCYPEEKAPASPESKDTHNADACMVSPVLLYIRLTQCLKQCGLDGLILLAWEGLDMIVAELSQYLNQSVSEVMERAQTALRYVSYELQHQGEDPVTYQEFKHLAELADKQTETGA